MNSDRTPPKHMAVTLETDFWSFVLKLFAENVTNTSQINLKCLSI